MEITSTTDTNNEKTCMLCNENVSKYCCPRCNALYCSLSCYKSEKHIQCSEDFYRDCITEELAQSQADEASKQKMIDILSKLNREDIDNSYNIEDDINDFSEKCSDGSEIDSDDNEYIDLNDRLNGLDLNNAEVVWNALTEEERNEFAALVSKGEVDKIIERWEPWWLYQRKDKLINEVSDNSEDKLEEEALTKCPVVKKVLKLNDLTSVKPSPAIKFNIINVLASYAFVARFFNGDIEPIEGATCLLEICANLESNANFDDPQLAVESVAQKCIQSNFIETDDESLEVMKHDTLLILNGPSSKNKSYYCQAALSHLCEILTMAKNVLKSKKPTGKTKSNFSKMFPDHTSENLDTIDLSKIRKCIKKIEYFMSYITSYGIIQNK